MTTGWLAIAALVAGRSLPAQDPGPPARLADGLEVAAPAAAGLRPRPLAALTPARVRDSFPNTTSVLVLKRGVLVFERYFGAGGPDVLNDTRSAMKSVTALAIGAALADRFLRSADEAAFARLAHHAPFRHDGALKQGITLADLLTMSSALDCNDWDDASPGNEERMYPLRDWTRWAVDLPVRRSYARDTIGRGPFSYCTAGVFLLGRILERASGEPVDRYLDRRLLGPLGIRRREWPRSPTGEVMTGGGLRLRSRDLAKLGLLVAAEGRWNGRQIIPAEWIAAMLTVRRSVDEQQRYGYLYWEREYASPCGRVTGWFMSGNGGNVVVYVPSQGLVAVVTRRHYNQRGMHQQTVRLIEGHLLAALSCGG